MLRILYRGALIPTLFIIGIITVTLFATSVGHAAINNQINFQGKLTNPDGTNVANGNYSIVFSMYTVASGGSAVWTETQGSVAVNDGIFQTSLGSVTSLPGSVDFNSGNIYLGVKVGADAEMTPRILFTASPYAFNSDKLGGLSSAGFTQLAQGLQVDGSTTNASIAINKTGATAKLMDLQRGGVSVFSINNDGSTLIKNSADSATEFQVQDSLGVSLLTVDATTDRLYVGNPTSDNIGTLLVLDSKNTTGDPTGVNGGSYYNSFEGRSRCYEGSAWYDCLGVPRPNDRRTTQITYPGSGTTFNLLGDIATAGTAGTAVAATTTEPGMLNYATTATINTVNHVSGNTNYNTSNNIVYQSYVAIPVNTVVRVWVGTSNQTAATMSASANPAGYYAAFRYDTVAGDVNYQCITKNNVAQNIIDSGIAPGTVGHKLEIIESLTEVVFRIDGVRVCRSTTNLPAANTMMRYTNTVTTLEAIIKNLRVGWIYIESNK